jgi:hypothetical protein
MKYVVTFTTAKGERREIVVELTKEEQSDCERQAISHGHSRAEGWPPLENRYAANRAQLELPASAVTCGLPEVRRVAVH